MIKSCNSLSNSKIIAVTEEKKSFRIENSSGLNINKVTVDGCFMPNKELRCDYLFEVLDKNIVFYVELKGSDISHAVGQLENTLEFCKSIHNGLNKECFIVASKFPKAGTSSQEYKLKFLRKNKVQLFIDTQVKIKVI